MSSADGLREQLEQEIVAGILKPGNRLDEVALAERFSVSRTPVREALQRLAMSGLVEHRPQRGTFVRKISIAEMIEMFEVMAELEGMCGRLSARRISPQQAVQLRETLNNCETAARTEDVDAYYHANAEFHSIIYEASHNSFLAEQARLLHTQLAPYRRLQLRVHHRMRQSMAEHIEIANCILAGNGSKAEATMKSHVAIQGEKFSDFVSTLTPQYN
ncbi:MAG: GntR family transcriptional regulator [Rhodobacteraceae bacterium]|nr:GntR family transcriptional regulator [Paracoccaceae bacterium]